MDNTNNKPATEVTGMEDLAILPNLTNSISQNISSVKHELSKEQPDETGLKLKCNGKVAKIYDNVAKIILTHLGSIIIKYDEIAKKICFVGAPPWSQPSDAKWWSDNDTANLIRYIEMKYDISPSKEMIETALSSIKGEIAFNPIKARIESVTWDGIERLDTLLIDYLGADVSTPSKYKYVTQVTRKTLVAAIARIYDPDPVKFDQMLLLIGAQGIGKSTLLAKLGGPYYDGSLSMDDMEGKTAKEIIVTSWITEIQECNGMNRTEAATIKKFLSTLEDKFRPAYGKHVIQAKRIGIIVGTTNEPDGILRDTTGNRRFWPVECNKELRTKFVWDLSDSEVLQILAEAKYYFDQGESLLLDLDVAEEALIQQEAAVVTDPLQGPFETWLEGRDVVCSIEAYTGFFSRDKSFMSRQDTFRMTRMLKKAGWVSDTKPTRYKDYGPQRLWHKANEKGPDPEQITIDDIDPTNPKASCEGGTFEL